MKNKITHYQFRIVDNQFRDILLGIRKWDIRFNLSAIEPGDTIHLLEYSTTDTGLTGRSLSYVVKSVFAGKEYGLPRDVMLITFSSIVSIEPTQSYD